MNIDIARLRELAKARTQGEWEWDNWFSRGKYIWLHRKNPIDTGDFVLYAESLAAPQPEDADYIVAACNALPGLLDELETLRNLAHQCVERLALYVDDYGETPGEAEYRLIADLRQALQGGAVNE